MRNNVFFWDLKGKPKYLGYMRCRVALVMSFEARFCAVVIGQRSCSTEFAPIHLLSQPWAGLFTESDHELKPNWSEKWTNMTETIFLEEKIIYHVLGGLSLAHVLSDDTEGEGFRTYIAARHQVAMELFWLHFGEALMLSIFIYSQCISQINSKIPSMLAENKLLVTFLDPIFSSILECWSDKTRNLKMLPWFLGNRDWYLSLFSDRFMGEKMELKVTKHTHHLCAKGILFGGIKICGNPTTTKKQKTNKTKKTASQHLLWTVASLKLTKMYKSYYRGPNYGWSSGWLSFN